MKKDAKFYVVKDIPLQSGGVIKKNTVIYRTHGCIYMDGGLLSPDYQEDFESLIEYEEEHGWNHLEKV